jgi:hypothetical protein
MKNLIRNKGDHMDLNALKMGFNRGNSHRSRALPPSSLSRCQRAQSSRCGSTATWLYGSTSTPVRTAVLALLFAVMAVGSAEAQWRRHTIDASSRGADGVRLADLDGDGYLDIVTPWEQGGTIRVYFYPGVKRCRALWPQVTVGNVKSPEDALLVDLDGDFVLDVVSCAEGAGRTVTVHWAPGDVSQVRSTSAWQSQAIPDTVDKQLWMFAVPLDIDGRHELDLAVGSKGSRGAIGWLQTPKQPRDVEAIEYHKIRSAGWIMSLVAEDMDGDGDQDLLVSDRKGEGRGVFWLENPGPLRAARPGAWTEHTLGGSYCEVMFLDLCDLDGDQSRDVLVATRNERMLWFRPDPALPEAWQELTIPNPFGVPHGKAVRVGDIDLDGTVDIVHSANTEGDRSKPGLTWMKRTSVEIGGSWKATNVSGERGVKFDLVELIDLDEDGDLDIVACEERDQLGVLWYENPQR